jgi:hypothetical protein
MKNRVLKFLLVPLMFVASGAWAQSAALPQVSGRQSLRLSAQEKTQTESAVLSDKRIQQVFGAEKPRVSVGEAQVDKAEAQAFLRGDTEKPPTHRVWAIVFNPKTNKAARALILLEQNSVLQVREMNPVDVPLSREDADEALALAKADSAVRRVVGDNLDKFVILESGSDAIVPLAAQVLRVRSSDPHDRCSADRCLDIIFRTTDGGYLPLRAGVDLTAHTVTVVNSRPMKGKHQ